MSLHCLVYTSVANHKISDRHLKSLLAKCRINNERRDITGILLYLDPFFIQILEGDKNIVESLFETIKSDARHHKVRIIYQKPIEVRSFPNWTMGFKKVSDEDIESVDGFTDFWQRPISEFFGDTPSKVEKMLEKLLDKFKRETLF